MDFKIALRVNYTCLDHTQRNVEMINMGGDRMLVHLSSPLDNARVYIKRFMADEIQQV